MRIGIDARFFDEHSGIGKYTRNVLSEMKNFWHREDIVLFGNNDELKNFGAEYKQISGHPYSLLGNIDMLRQARGAKPDILYFTHFAVPLGLRVPFIVTIHDLTMKHFASRETSNLNFPLFYGKRAFFNQTLKNAVSRGRDIIAISLSSKKDIAENYRIDESKIHAIYPGIPELPPESSLPQELRGKKYILYVGTFYPHKNVALLFDAISHFPPLNLALVCPQDSFLLRLKERFSQNTVFLNNLTPAELAACYKNCLAFIQPSLMEGFGFPSLEALRCGAKVFASDIPAHREILGEAVSYFDPLSKDSLAKLIQRHLIDGKPYAGGFDKLPRQYSFRKAALEIWKVLTEEVK